MTRGGSQGKKCRISWPSSIFGMAHRRTQENSDVLGGCGKERTMIRTELLRRLRQDNVVARLLWRDPAESPKAAHA